MKNFTNTINIPSGKKDITTHLIKNLLEPNFYDEFSMINLCREKLDANRISLCKSLLYYEVFLFHKKAKDLDIRYKKKKYKNKNLLYQLIYQIVVFRNIRLENEITFNSVTYFINEIIKSLPDLLSSSYSHTTTYLCETLQLVLNLLYFIH